MIQIQNKSICLQTKLTSYIMCADDIGNLFHLYYGAKVDFSENTIQALMPKSTNPIGCAVIVDTEQPSLSLQNMCLEVSTRGKGDFREPFIEIQYSDGSTTSDFRFDRAELLTEKPEINGLPSSYFSEPPETSETVVVYLKDKNSPLELQLFYTVFEECDCITRFSRLVNNSADAVIVRRFMSAQLDVDMPEVKVLSFHGEWAREMNRHDLTLQAGQFVSSSRCGSSSNKSNPFLIYAEKTSDETSGFCYASNLVYSGDHKESVEFNGYGQYRILTGINPDTFSYSLNPEESLDSPEAVLTCSTSGYDGISKHMHRFVREHIVRGYWQHKERPILLNSWEAMYFNVRELRVLMLARLAKRVGVELFVLDDGWFGKRDDETSSLGDWTDNLSKLPNGLAGLSKRIKNMGMKFGIWVEPEMVSENSDLYRAHPDWAVKNPNTPHSLGRHQMVLDLTRKDVQDYLIESMTDVFTRSDANYVKWDMNRNFSDCFSNTLDTQSEFSFRYIKGLYSVINELVKRFPNILFEGCASGGNRFDLGMLCYMPQIWASDCTDAFQRCSIQNGYSYGYPQSTMGCHVSASPNHQTLRHTPIETRFAIASAGILGYEINLLNAKIETLTEISNQIKLYKQWRNTLQYGDMYRLSSNLGANHSNVLLDTEAVRWIIVSKDKSNAVAITMQNRALPNYGHRKFVSRGLDDNTTYHFYNRELKYDVRRMGDLINTASPIYIRPETIFHDLVARVYKLDGEAEDYTLSGRVLNNCGVRIAENYAGTGLEANTALYQDNDTRMYFMEKAEE